MDIITVASSLTALLGPLLPYLLKAGDKAAEETGKSIAGKTWELATSLWSKLSPKVEAKPAALEAAQDLAQTPDDKDSQATLRKQLTKLLTEDETLAAEVSKLIEKGKAAGVNITVTASGERSVAIGGDFQGGSIITGEGNR